MIRITYDDGVICEVDVRDRVTVYLDNDAIIDMAKGPQNRRDRFVEAIRTRGRLMFSMVNAAEIGGPKGASAQAVRALLDSIGACLLGSSRAQSVEGRREGGAGRVAASGDLRPLCYLVLPTAGV